MVTGESLAPLGDDLWLLALNGVATAFAYATHYRALELGPVAVVSPIGAATPSWPSLSMVVLDERPGGLALTGAAIAVVGVALVSTDSPEAPRGDRGHAGRAVGDRGGDRLRGGGSCSAGSPIAGWAAGLWGSRIAQVACYVPLALFFRTELARLRLGSV